MRFPEHRLLPWLIAAALLVNGAAGWWFWTQRELRLTVPPRVAEPDLPVPTLTLLREQAEPAPDQTATEAPDAAVAEPPAPPGAAPDESVGPPEPLSAADGAPVPGVAAESAQCVLVGPGADAAEVERWRAAIAAPDAIGADTLVQNGPSVTGYRVLVSAPPAPEATLTRLAAAGFGGFIADRDGRGARISVGLFEVRANAERQLAELRRQGYVAEILPNLGMRASHWLRLRISAQDLPAAKAALKQRFPGASPVWRACPAGA